MSGDYTKNTQGARCHAATKGKIHNLKEYSLGMILLIYNVEHSAFKMQ